MPPTDIEWATDVWNPLAGCNKVSPGCANCYAITMANRLQAMGVRKYHGTVQKHPNGKLDWTGKINLDETALELPLHWKKSRRIFVNSMSDLFHENVPFDFIDKIFAVMAACPQHIFQVLTKRPSRMLEYFRGCHPERSEGSLGSPNVWLGVSCENQQTADERIPLLLQCPAAVRWVSAEPLLEAVDLRPYLQMSYLPNDAAHWANYGHNELHWVVVGGESGPHARPMHPEWARELRDQCTKWGVPFFFKQWGEWYPIGPLSAPQCWACFCGFHGTSRDELAKHANTCSDGRRQNMYLIGKSNSGRHLDGREYNEYPSS